MKDFFTNADGRIVLVRGESWTQPLGCSAVGPCFCTWPRPLRLPSLAAQVCGGRDWLSSPRMTSYSSTNWNALHSFSFANAPIPLLAWLRTGTRLPEVPTPVWRALRPPGLDSPPGASRTNGDGFDG